MTNAAAETRSVIVEREFPYPPEKLWRALTQPHLLEEWLMKNDFRPVEGHRFTLRNEPKPEVNIAIDCEV
ncbi:MAG: SRPBCC family protein, partial [Devosia sp.]